MGNHWWNISLIVSVLQTLLSGMQGSKFSHQPSYISRTETRRPKIKLLFSGATFHIPLTKSATMNEQAFTLQSMAIFRGSFLHFGGEIARSPSVIFSLAERETCVPWTLCADRHESASGRAWSWEPRPSGQVPGRSRWSQTPWSAGRTGRSPPATWSSNLNSQKRIGPMIEACQFITHLRDHNHLFLLTMLHPHHS